MPNSNADSTHPSQPSLSSLPDDIVLRCLVFIPRIYHLNISWVSKHLRSLVRSPELNALRSILPRSSSLHVCFQEIHGNGDDEEDHSTFHWFPLTSTEEEEYGFFLNPTPFPPHPNYCSSAVVSVDSKIFFIGGSREHSTDLWILDTRSGNITQGPSMSVPRVHLQAVVGVIDGIYTYSEAESMMKRSKLKFSIQNQRLGSLLGRRSFVRCHGVVPRYWRGRFIWWSTGR